MNKQHFGVMLDMSRNAVMKKEKVKEYASVLSKMGYNTLMLYTEDTYEVKGEPRFGYLRGGYSEADIKEIDAHCKAVGIELIPCIQTLAHLNAVFKWSEYRAVNDVNDILLVENERTYALIENMFKTLSECFTSRTVNLGMDEAHMLGLGKYLRQGGVKDKFSLFVSHVRKVCDIAEKYGFEPLIWSDMYFRLLGNGGYENGSHGAEEERVSKARETVPSGLGLIYWEYFFYKKEDYARMLEAHKLLCDNVWFAGAVHTYIGFCTNNALSDDTLRPAMEAVREEKIKNVIITLWGEGAECSYFLALPSLCRARCAYEGISDEDVIAERFLRATGEDYNAFYALDVANTAAGHYRDLPEIDFSKYSLFNDIFGGFLDTSLTLGAADSFKEKAALLKQKKSGSRYGYLFDTQIALLETLYEKHDLGILLRQAYLKGDRSELEKLHKRILRASDRLREFYYAYRMQWLTENNPQGMEVTDIKLGGLMLRLHDCAERLEDYLRGRADSIPELSQPLIESDNSGNFLKWSQIVSVNILE